VRPPKVLLKRLASQLGHPRGGFGRLIARMLNKGNNGTITAAVEATDPQPGQVAADIGFGGGLGLALLLDRVGQVHGVDISTSMIERARREFRAEVSAGRLRLQQGSLTALPLADGSVHALITVNTIYFVADLPQAFAELARVLASDGRAVVGLADPAAMAQMPFTEHGFRLRPVAEVIDLLGSAGLELADHRRVGEGDHAYHLLVARHVAS
jgi:arsenite methyltransferase